MANVITPKFRVSFPSVFQPKRNELNGKDEYSVQALFAKGENLDALKKAVDAAATEKFGDKAKWPKNLKLPFRDQGDREKEENGKSFLPSGYVKGAVYINLKSQMKPQVVDQALQEIINPSDFYAGCWARASVRAFAYDQKGNKGVSIALVHLQKVADGEAFSGRTKAQDDFVPIENTDTEKSASEMFG